MSNQQSDLGRAGTKILTKFRSLVSRDNVRTVDEELGLNLDLTFITERLVAMSFPAEKISTIIRNNINDVVKYFEWKHDGKYIVINLVHNSEMTYDAKKFHGKMHYYGSLDNHSPSLNQIISIAQSIKNFLEQDPSNVAAIHCKTGRGRTGTVAAAYLLYSGLCQTPEDAINLFSQKRTNRNASVISVPSQLRYALSKSP
jgi:phosphatidylinositol-3,4,5-trisphosphate 3-phosphatase and dual-specificity protein phosphatase PTEN